MDVSEVDDCLSAFASEGVAAVSGEEVDALPVFDTLTEPVLEGLSGGMDIPEPFAGLGSSVGDLVLSLFPDGTFSALASPSFSALVDGALSEPLVEEESSTPVECLPAFASATLLVLDVLLSSDDEPLPVFDSCLNRASFFAAFELAESFCNHGFVRAR